MRGKSSGCLIILFLLYIVICSPSCVTSEDPGTIEDLTLTVYFDGFVLVNYELRVKPSNPTVNVTIIGQTVEDILVVDEKGLPLDYSLVTGVITVYSLGAERIEITYFTQDLTSKIGRYWTLQVEVPINTTVVLPSEASIIDLNVVPEMIESLDSQVVIVVPSGFVDVTYVARKRLAQTFPHYEVLVIIVASIVVGGAIIYRFRKKPQPQEEEEPEMDLEKLFREHQDLRPEERQAIELLAENHGRAFEAEMYEKLQIPRTTTWRMIKRLEKMKIIKITKSRRQNLVSIRTKYRKKSGSNNE